MRKINFTMVLMLRYIIYTKLWKSSISVQNNSRIFLTYQEVKIVKIIHINVFIKIKSFVKFWSKVKSSIT